jgi:hydrogenase maturation factor HypF (carbamoyltransferase family)
LKGYVSNDELGVIIICQGENSETFFKEIHHRKPKSSEIIFSEIKEIETAEILKISSSNLPKKTSLSIFL